MLPNVTGSLDLTQYHQYCSTGIQHQPWHYFPRNLKAKEYCNPHKALEKFTDEATKKEWKEILQNIQGTALANNSLFELGYDPALVSRLQLLLKMVEGCYLIYIRNN